MDDDVIAVRMARILGMGNGGEESDAPRPVHEAQIEMLKEIYERYGVVRFQPGDIVTPVRGMNIRSAGEPHIVLETRPNAEPLMPSTIGDISDVGSSSFGRRLDMRVATCFQDNTYTTYWVESWQFENYPT